VLGASQYSVQLSGSTCTITDPATTLPRRDVPVVRPRYELGDGLDEAALTSLTRAVTHAVHSRLASHGSEEHPDEDVALALQWTGLPFYPRLRAFAEGIVDGVAARTARGLPVLLVLDADIARTLGRVLRDDLGLDVPLVVLDGLRLDDFDYVDLGRVRQPSGTVPVTIKSLVFSGVDVRQVRPAAPVG
jgi:ethanolamine utilization protein EutA